MREYINALMHLASPDMEPHMSNLFSANFSLYFSEMFLSVLCEILHSISLRNQYCAFLVGFFYQ